ncbi:hypothetical protein GCM10011611_32920 [Aliidongia dinghuensis]|uniref:DUF6455 domain-containing protein n=1 Tax=Aliidongia dinghuensis TaxID=1867774 RepID=A0A8J2YWB7_9PROT|nr:DUF6455 family protein [Aliidongia dinghuensis]GGF24286.1 hypothetical protein GCM10011611_32920 [Aliidongia dinghuensis]
MGGAGRVAGTPVGGSSILALAARLKRRATAAVLEARARQTLRHELALLADLGQLDQVLADCGLSPSDLAVLERPVRGWARRLQAMQRQLGVEALAETCDLALIRDMDRVCRHCSAAKICEKWLRADAVSAAPAFCPNRPNFELLRQGACN